MNEILKQIENMHNKFQMTSGHIKFTDEEKAFRALAMYEEVSEYMRSKTKEQELDALVDLIIFAIGTVERQDMLYIFEEAFNRIMRANCKKTPGSNKKRGSFKIDLVKPEGWIAPDLSDLFDNEDPQMTMDLNDISCKGEM